jgi:4-amino-4-deoxy-L-arabinose transferase-like glycosyltransferase
MPRFSIRTLIVVTGLLASLLCAFLSAKHFNWEAITIAALIYLVFAVWLAVRRANK